MPIAETVADALRKVSGKETSPRTSAVIVAAGNSVRMGKNQDKPFIRVADVPVLVHTLIAFQKAADIGEIILIVREDDITAVESLIEEWKITKVRRVSAGGSTRPDSVRIGFSLIDPSSKFVAIHDGARCLITPEIIHKVCRAAYRYKAATAACRVTDTVKLTTKHGFIEKTLDRNKVFLVQTPQIFDVNLYHMALLKADDTKIPTDDNQLIEALPFPIKLVDCGTENLKITYPQDLRIAECILKGRQNT